MTPSFAKLFKRKTEKKGKAKEAVCKERIRVTLMIIKITFSSM